MSEKAKAVLKTPGQKSNNQTYKSQELDYSGPQPVSTPIDRIMYLQRTIENQGREALAEISKQSS